MAVATLPATADGGVTTLVRWFENSVTSTRNGRRDSERYRDYYDGRQLTSAERALLRKRGQPEVVINRIQGKVNTLLGIEIQQRTDPQAFPRNPDDEESAEAATDALRFVCDANQFSAIRSSVWENMLVEGCGAAEVVAEGPSMDDLMSATSMTPPEPDVKIYHVSWDSLFWDPHSRKHDFTDARYLGYVRWMDFDEALARWPEASSILDQTKGNPRTDDMLEDKPDHIAWVDSTRSRVRIVCMYFKDASGNWQWSLFTKGGTIDGGPVPYKAERGNECPLIVQAAYRDRDNDPYGVVRVMVGPQDEINKRRSKALHRTTMRQSRVARSMDPNEVRQELAKPDGVVQADKDEFEVLPGGDQFQGEVLLLQEAKSEIDLMGPNAAMSGKDPKDQSGRAILAQQQGGYVELGPLMSRLRDWTHRIYRAVWNRIRQYWTAERWIRVTDNENNIRFVGLNRQTTALEALQKQIQKNNVDPQRAEMVLSQASQDPRANIPVMENSVAEMDVDIIVDQAPDTVTIQQEQYELLGPIVQAAIGAAPDKAPQLLTFLVKASQLRNKDELVELLEGGPPDPQAQQMQQAQMELQMRGARAQVQKTEAEAFRSQAQGQAALMQASRSEAEPQPVDPLERLHLAAQIGKTRAETLKTIADATRPPPQPRQAA